MSRAAINAFAGGMRPAGHEFETPAVQCTGLCRASTLPPLHTGI